MHSSPRRSDLGFAAMNITHPCKQLVLDIVDELDTDAAHLQAVNLVVFDDDRLIGYNTDWMGYRDGLIAGLPGASFERVVQIGCGGAGAATAYALLSRGTARLDLSDVDGARAEDLAARMRAHFPDADGRDCRTGRPSRSDRARDRGRPRDTDGDAPSPGGRLRPRPAQRRARGCRMSCTDRSRPSSSGRRPNAATRCSTAAGWLSARHTLVSRSSRARRLIVTGWSGTSVRSSVPRSGLALEGALDERSAERCPRQRDDRRARSAPRETSWMSPPPNSRRTATRAHGSTRSPRGRAPRSG